MTEVKAKSGSAERWGPRWGARPADWALSEDQQVPTYEAALERVELKAGQRVLDIGCGAGAFLRLVTDRGARAFGLVLLGGGKSCVCDEFHAARRALWV